MRDRLFPRGTGKSKFLFPEAPIAVSHHHLGARTGNWAKNPSLLGEAFQGEWDSHTPQSCVPDPLELQLSKDVSTSTKFHLSQEAGDHRLTSLQSQSLQRDLPMEWKGSRCP